MKNRIALLAFAAVAAFTAPLFNGCASNQAAVGVYDAGYATASDILDHDASLAPMIQDVAAKLPKLNAGLSDADLGTLGGELAILKDNFGLLKNLFPGDTSKLDKANTLVSGWISGTAASSGGKVVALPGIVADGILQNFSSGLTGGISYWTAKHAVVHP